MRRLHLVIVDTWRQKWLVRNNVDQLRKSMRTETAGPLTRNTTPIRLSAEDGRQQHQVRFVYGYALDGSTYPCYCICPTRTDDCSFQLMDSATGYISAISQTASIRPLGVAHFYDAFSVSHELDKGPNFRNDALRAFDLPEAAISDDLKVVLPWANQILPAAGRAHAVLLKRMTMPLLYLLPQAVLPPPTGLATLARMPPNQVKVMTRPQLLT